MPAAVTVPMTIARQRMARRWTMLRSLLTDVSGAAQVGMSTGWIAGHDDRDPMVPPDYTLSDITELPVVVERWLKSAEPINA